MSNITYEDRLRLRLKDIEQRLKEEYSTMSDEEKYRLNNIKIRIKKELEPKIIDISSYLVEKAFNN